MISSIIESTVSAEKCPGVSLVLPCHFILDVVNHGGILHIVRIEVTGDQREVFRGNHHVDGGSNFNWLFPKVDLAMEGKQQSLALSTKWHQAQERKALSTAIDPFTR